MKQIFTLLFGLFTGFYAMAQAPEGVFAKASVAPVIDGVVDAVWSEATAYNIDKAVDGETPSVGTPGETTWQGLWTENGVYVLLKVTDNAFYPNYLAGTGLNDYDYDKAELYFDVNDILTDGLGPSTSNSGHIQIAPGFVQDKNDGTKFTEGGVEHAFLVTGSNYIAEYFIPFTRLVNKDGIIVDKMNTIGFDVTIIDRDPGDTQRNQAVWSNTGASYSNMDDAGHVTFAGAEPSVLVTDLTITPTNGTITTDKGTLQLTANFQPANVTNKLVKWTITEGTTAQAEISPTGLLSAISNGVVVVKATSMDGSFVESPTVTVTITNQKRVVYSDAVWNSLNLIQNWDFDNDLESWTTYLDPPTAQLAPVIVEGAAKLVTDKSSDNNQWHYQLYQTGFTAEPNVPYVLLFKSWSDVDRSNTVDFEDSSTNGYNRYGASTDEEAVDGRSEWHYNTNAVPTWFKFHVTFDELIETSVQKLMWLESQASGTVYLDSILLIKESELVTSTKQLSSNSNLLRVYPNPVGNGHTLFVELASAKTKVAIYNAVGQKVMEKEAEGKLVRFDVGSLRKGMYFVKLSDGSMQKFIR